MSGLPGAPGAVSHGAAPCLVTGATGFIGGRLVERLLAAGWRVRCLVRPASDTAHLRRLGAELVVGDLAGERSPTSALRGCGAVVHCAALVSDWATVGELRAVNVHGTRRLLEAAAWAGVRRVVHVSTTDVYGHPGTREVGEDHAASRFGSWYAQTKREAEVEARTVSAQRGLGVAIVRPATVYGPGSRDVIAEIAAAIARGQMLLVDGGAADAGLVYVDNLADLVLLALSHPAAPGGAFNASDALGVSWRRFADDLAAGLGAPPPRLSIPYGAARGLGLALECSYRAARRATGLTLPPLLSRQAVDVLGRPQSFDTRAARERLGWAPQVGYEEGLAATLVWLREEGVSPLWGPSRG